MNSAEKKLKRKLQRIKNAKQAMIFQHAELHEENREKEREREESLREAAKKSGRAAAGKIEAPAVWSAKMQEIRNKIDGKKRMAEERWNRFAGTDDAGAMGR